MNQGPSLPFRPSSWGGAWLAGDGRAWVACKCGLTIVVEYSRACAPVFVISGGYLIGSGNACLEELGECWPTAAEHLIAGSIVKLIGKMCGAEGGKMAVNGL